MTSGRACTGSNPRRGRERRRSSPVGDWPRSISPTSSIDAGSGMGRDTMFYAEHVERAVGLDGSGSGVRRPRRRARRARSTRASTRSTLGVLRHTAVAGARLARTYPERPCHRRAPPAGRDEPHGHPQLLGLVRHAAERVGTLSCSSSRPIPHTRRSPSSQVYRVAQPTRRSWRTRRTNGGDASSSRSRHTSRKGQHVAW